MKICGYPFYMVLSVAGDPNLLRDWDVRKDVSCFDAVKPGAALSRRQKTPGLDQYGMPNDIGVNYRQYELEHVISYFFDGRKVTLEWMRKASVAWPNLTFTVDLELVDVPGDIPDELSWSVENGHWLYERI